MSTDFQNPRASARGAVNTPRWYMVNKMGMATLCTDKEGAEQEAADAQRFWSHMGPHRAVQLVEAASVAASAGSEPVATVFTMDAQAIPGVQWQCGPQANGFTAPQADSQPAPDEIINMAREQGLPETEIEGVFRVNADDLCRVAAAILASRATADSVTAPAGGANWQDISTAPKDGTRFVAVGQNYGLDSEKQHTCIAQWFRGCWMDVSEWNEASELKYLTHWMPLLPLPGTAARKQGANHD